MLRRLLAFIVVAAVALVVLHYWKRDVVTDVPVRSAAREIGQEARTLGTEAKQKLVEVGADLRDAKITGAVKAALSLNRNLGGYPVEVSTDDRVVTLRGRLERREVRARIESLVAEVPDVRRVVNQIEIGAAQSEAGGSPQERAAAGQRALDANPSLRGRALRVRVEADRVVVSGEVGTPAEMDLAGALAREAAGVPVENRVAVRPGAPTTPQ